MFANQILKNGMFSNNRAILVKEQIDITTPFYDEISKYLQSILANISSTKQRKMHPKFR
jgi:DICT domain-containing protein